MGLFLWGFLAGAIVCAIAAAIGARLMSRRIVTLERRAQQAERLAELGTLTGGLAHEIKNPLSTVQLNLQLLQEEFDPRDPATTPMVARLGTVQRETTRLREILDDFLRYAGKIELERQPVDLNNMLEELVDFFAPQAALQKVQLRLCKSDRPVIAWVDPRFIKQAVLNLMINALQAMSEQGGELILSAGQADGHAIIHVTDTGPGIAAEAMDRIFQAYYSTKRGGTGLGLAIARRIVEEHSGEISVKSEVGKGSDFTIALPLTLPTIDSRAQVPHRG